MSVCLDEHGLDSGEYGVDYICLFLHLLGLDSDLGRDGILNGMNT